MAKTDFKSVDEYQDTFEGAKKERLQAVRSIIRGAAPEAEEVISYQIPAYKQWGGPVVYYSGATNHISLSYPFSDALLSEFKTELASYKVSKSAIQMPDSQPLPEDMIRRIVQFRVKENEAAAALKPKKKGK